MTQISRGLSLSTIIKQSSLISSSDAGEALACRRWDLLSPIVFCSSKLVGLLKSRPSSQSFRTFSLWKNLDGVILYSDRGKRWSPPIILPIYPLLPTLMSKSSQSETYKSSGAAFFKSELCFRFDRSGYLPASPEAPYHRISWTARAPPPPAHQLLRPWLRFEPSEYYWLLEAFGPSVHVLPPVISTAAHSKTLGWLEFPLNGLGPCSQQQHPGPTYSLLKFIPKELWPTK